MAVPPDDDLFRERQMDHHEDALRLELINAAIAEAFRRMSGRKEPMTQAEMDEAALWVTQRPELRDVTEALKAFKAFRELPHEDEPS
jgi:hypothetical protein